MDTRIYFVRDRTAANAPEAHYLVRAANAAQALRKVAGDRFTVSVATPDESFALGKAGVEITEANGGAADEESV